MSSAVNPRMLSPRGVGRGAVDRRHEELSQFLKPRLYRGVGAVTHSVQPRARV